MGIQERGITRHPEKTKASARALFAEGMTPAEIAKKLGIDNGTFVVRRWCDDDFRRAHNADVNRRRQAPRCEA